MGVWYIRPRDDLFPNYYWFIVIILYTEENVFIVTNVFGILMETKYNCYLTWYISL